MEQNSRRLPRSVLKLESEDQQQQQPQTAERTTAEIDSGDRVLGMPVLMQVVSPNASPDTDQDASLVQIEENVCIQKDSIVNIPKGISDADASSMML